MSDLLKTVYDLIAEAEKKLGEENDELVEIHHDMSQAMEEIYRLRTKLRILINAN